MPTPSFRHGDQQPATQRWRLRSWRVGPLVGSLSLGLASAVGLTACSSGSPKAASRHSSAPTTTRAASGISSSALARDANALCADVSRTKKVLHQLNLSSPSSAATALSTISTDVHKLQAAVRKVAASDRAGASGPVRDLVRDTKTAVNEGKSSLTQFERGNIGNAESDFNTALNDLSTARIAGKKANLRACV